MTGKSRKEYNKQWCKDNPKKVKEWHKKWAKNNKEHVNNYLRQWRKDNPEKEKGRTLRESHNLSYENWLKMWEVQNGKCLICGKKFTKPSDACVDHNHKTGNIRGLLCSKCNLGLGFFKDNPKLTAKATEYLLGDKNG